MAVLKDWAFHHLGIACESIAVEMSVWESVGYRPEGDFFVDESQGIRGLFMTGGGPRIELLEAANGSATLTPWLKRRIKIYHMGYLTALFDEAMENAIASGATLTRSPMRSTYFKSRIVFLMVPNMGMIELIEDRASPVAGARTSSGG